MLKKKKIYGVEIWPGMGYIHREKIRALEPVWIRIPLLWSDVEKEKNVYTWNNSFENDLRYLIGNIIVTLKDCPDWAKEESRSCGRIRERHIPDYVNFVEQVILRYPEIKYIEIWNEPDSAYGEDKYYGCWGSDKDYYYGGMYYTKVMNAVYKLKEKYPQVNFIYGSLMLPDTKGMQATYLEGSLKTKINFDILGFHYYSWYRDPDKTIRDEVNFLKRILKKYKYSKPIILTETSLLRTAKPNADFLIKQAEYVRKINKESIQCKLLGWIWYALPCTGWNNSGLLNEDGSPKPAYTTLLSLNK